MCSDPGQEIIKQDIRDFGLNRVVIAACSPRMHEPTFRKTLQKAGLNPYLLEMANIREQCSWVHDDPARRPQKPRRSPPRPSCAWLITRRWSGAPCDMCPDTLVIGGGIAGMTAALELAEAGNRVYPGRAQDHLGGNIARVDLTAPYLDSARDMLTERVTRVVGHPRIDVLLGTQVAKVDGFVGNFKATLRTAGNGSGPRDVVHDVGSVVVCTGYKEFDASRMTHYGYGKLPNVITSFEFENDAARRSSATKEGKPPQYVAIIHCVGSRNQEFHALLLARLLHDGAQVRPRDEVAPCLRPTSRDIYVDMHAFGKGCEDFYRRSSEVKTLFLMYAKNDYPVVRAAGPDDDCTMLIRSRNSSPGETIELPADLVILMVGMEPREDAEEVARLVNISRDKDGWFIESHPKLDPVATTTDGVFIAGACQVPKGHPGLGGPGPCRGGTDPGPQARGKIEIDAVFAEVDEERCSGLPRLQHPVPVHAPSSSMRRSGAAT